MSHSKQFLIFFLNPPKPLIPGTPQDLFTLDLAHEGSNRCDSEEESAIFWVTFLFKLGKDGSLSFQDDDTQTLAYLITLPDILNFGTGSTEVPLYRLCTHSDDQFQHHSKVSHCFHMFKQSNTSTRSAMRGVPPQYSLWNQTQLRLSACIAK